MLLFALYLIFSCAAAGGSLTSMFAKCISQFDSLLGCVLSAAVNSVVMPSCFSQKFAKGGVCRCF